MNILFVTLCSIELNTSAMIRNNALVKGLIENGNQVDILTLPSLRINPFYDETINWDENINILNLKANGIHSSLVEYKENFVGKIKTKLLPLIRGVYHSLSLFDNTIFVARKADKRFLNRDYYDLIISSSDPKSSHYAVHQLIRSGLRYGKWIQYWGDPLAIDITKKAVHPKSYVKHKEKQLFSFADRIVYVSPFTLEEQMKMFPEFKERMRFLPIAYSKKKLYEQNRSTNAELKLGYFGDYNSRIRNIKNLYEVCNRENVSLVIAGNSDLELSETSNISISSRIPQSRLEDLEASCDVLVCVLNKTGTQIPGKVYHYAATNKPILVILDGDMKEKMGQYLKKFKRYILCDNNENSIRNKILEIRKNNRDYIPSPFFESKNIAKQFIDFAK